jgi:S1-C subfamily serine protease
MALAACGSSSTPDATSSATAEGGGRLSAQELVKQVMPGTVSIVTQPPGESNAPSKHGAHAHGSGVIWDAEGRVLTSNHLVENAGKITVTVNGTTEVPAHAVARAQCNDVAVLQLDAKPPGLTAIAVGKSADLEIGDVVTAVGYLKPASATHASPIANRGTVSARNVSASVSALLPELPSVVLHQAATTTQMSGGALVNDRGRFVGLLTLVPNEEKPSPGLFAAVSSDYLNRRIAQLEETPNGVLSGWRDQHRCHGNMLTIANRVLVHHGPPGEHEH